MTAQQLKNSILQLAVQGKLVPQDPSDEPASVLLERIRAEKEALIKAKKIKREKNPSVIFRGADNIPYEKIGDDVRSLADYAPFEIPDTWEWVKLSDVCDIINGFTPLKSNPDFWENGSIPWFTIEDVHIQGRRIYKTTQYISEKALGKDSTRILPPNTVLLCCTASVGEYAITEIPLTTNQQFNGLVIKEYYQKYYSPEFLLELVQTFKLRLLNVAGKTTFNFVSVKKLGQLLIPLLPIKEQLRIVKRVREVTPFVEQYDTKEKDLDLLNQSFPIELKKAILQWAVQGKLVPQDENDEPAEALLARIRAEKEALIRAGKIKRDKHESVIFRRDNSHYEKRGSETVCIDEELPFNIPSSWTWCRASALGNIVRGNGIKRTETVLDGLPCIRYGEIYTTYNHSFEKTKSFVPKELFDRCKHISYGDVVFTLTGENKPDIAKAVVYLGTQAIAAGGDLAFWTQHGMNPLYLMFVLNSPYAISKKVVLATGDIIVHISGDKIGSILIPIPPLEEQERIVKRIFEMYALCDDL